MPVQVPTHRGLHEGNHLQAKDKEPRLSAMSKSQTELICPSSVQPESDASGKSEAHRHQYETSPKAMRHLEGAVGRLASVTFPPSVKSCERRKGHVTALLPNTCPLRKTPSYMCNVPTALQPRFSWLMSPGSEELSPSYSALLKGFMEMRSIRLHLTPVASKSAFQQEPRSRCFG